MEEQRDAPARPLWVRIQTIRGDRGWSWERLERELGVSRSTIDKWKVARRSPQASTVNKVARVLDIDQEEALRLAGILPTEEEQPGSTIVEELRAELAELRRLNAEQAQLNSEMEAELRRRRQEPNAKQSHAGETTSEGFGTQSGRQAI